MAYDIGMYFFVIALGCIGIGYLYWKRVTKNGSTVARVVDVAVEATVEAINALVITPTRYIFRHIPESEQERVFNGWYTWQNKPIVICQSQSATGDLEKWEQQYHSISDDLPSKTPQELGAITEWECVVRPVYERKRGLLETINTMMMVGVFAAICLVGFLYYSSYIEASGGI